jgi:DNA polymerase-3 subunit alpha
VAGYSLGKADMLRRAMGKKKKEILDKEFVGFEAGMKAKGYSDEAVKTLWDILLPFSGYAFNKSHTAGYGIISFWTAYLKANFPAEFMAALLTSVGDDKDRMAVYLAECRRIGVKVLPPDVNQSAGQFTPVGDQIRFGLGAVRNVGANVVAAIVKARREKGAYTSFLDFLQKVDAVVCNKRTVESLIKAGAFDSLGHTRRGLLERHEQAIDIVVPLKRSEANGQFDLFGDVGTADESLMIGMDLGFSDQEWPRKTKLGFEREMLGLYVSDHPLAGAEAILRKHSENSIASLAEDVADGANVTIAGMISSLQRKVTKDGKVWAAATVEDLDASIEVLFFPKTYEAFGTELAEDLTMAVRGKVSRRDNGTSIVGMDLMVLDIGENLGAHPPVVIGLDANKVTPELVDDMRHVIEDNQGNSPLRIRLRADGRSTLLAVNRFRVDPSTMFVSEIKALLGTGCLE